MNAPAATEPTAALIGIVTVLFKCDDVLPDFFGSLQSQELGPHRIRLYVIDNSPTRSGTELSMQLAKAHGIDAICHFNDANRGVAAGNNQGIAMALQDGCSHVLLANNDTEFPSGTILGLLRSLLAHRVAAVTPKIYYHGTDKLLWYAGAPFSGWTVRGPHRGMRMPDQGRFDTVELTEYAPTCFMLVDVTAFARIGTMDEQYFCYYDDTDFVFRLRQAGLQLLYDPNQTLQHKVSTSTGGDESLFSLYYMNRNRVYFARKNLRGLQRWVALGYMTLTRVVPLLRLERAKATRLLEGVRDGWRLTVHRPEAGHDA
jgi:GT2 family glycosyltransferase